MKKWLFILPLLLYFSTPLLLSQDRPRRYYRSALTSMMVYHPEDEFGYDVYTIFKDLPTPDKYDNHSVGYSVIDNSYIHGVPGSAQGLHRQEYGKSLILTSAEKQANAEAILKVLETSQVAKRIVALWFNWTGDSIQNATFNTQLIEDRSDYNTSFADAEKIKYTIEGKAALRDVATELIENSFVLVSDITYITAEDRADAAKVTLGIIGGIADALTGGNSGRRMAQVAGDIADSFTGFKVMTHTYLYQLIWDEEKMNDFYVHYYAEVPDPAKTKAFIEDQTSFHLKFLGEESSTYEKTEKKGKYNRTELLQLITQRSIDKNIASLQSKHEAFRIKAPITSVEYNKNGKILGYRALIGEKEDVRTTSEFEVLEVTFEKGKVVYNRIGTVKPVNNQIWDNRFNALMENNIDVSTEGTLFKSVGAPLKPIVPGMLLKLKKQ